MKRIILLMLCTLFGVAMVQGQSYYGEIYRENSGKFEGKLWKSEKNLRGEQPLENGTNAIFIFQSDSAKFYTINTSKRTYMEIPFPKFNTNGMIGMRVEEGRNVEREYIKDEMVEGFLCKHYKVTVTTILTNGEKKVGGYEEWVSQKTGGWIRHKDGPFEEPIVLRNVQIGPQPANLFEIPQGYKFISLPAGGLMEMLTGKSASENQKNLNVIKEKEKETKKKIQSATEGKSKDEQMQNLLEMYNNVKKK